MINYCLPFATAACFLFNSMYQLLKLLLRVVFFHYIPYYCLGGGGSEWIELLRQYCLHSFDEFNGNRWAVAWNSFTHFKFIFVHLRIFCPHVQPSQWLTSNPILILTPSTIFINSRVAPPQLLHLIWWIFVDKLRFATSTQHSAPVRFSKRYNKSLN